MIEANHLGANQEIRHPNYRPQYPVDSSPNISKLVDEVKNPTMVQVS